MTISDRAASPAPLAAPRGYRQGSLPVDWLSSTDHKVIGHLYLITSFFFLVAGLMAIIMRAQLFGPDNHLVSGQQYNELFTVHGTIMPLLFATPLFAGIAGRESCHEAAQDIAQANIPRRRGLPEAANSAGSAGLEG